MLPTVLWVVAAVMPNVPPVFIGPNPAVINVDEDSTGYSPVVGFLAGMHVGELTGYQLSLFPNKKQDWWLDAVIVEQHPPLPTELFIQQPKLNPDTGSCSTTCAMGVCSPPVCFPLVSNLEFTIQPEVSGYVIVEITMKDSGGMYPGTDEYKQRVRININDINDGVPTFELSPSGTRKIEVYEDTCNVITGWVHKYDIGSDYEEYAGDTLDYQLFPSLGYTFERDIFTNESYPYQCGNKTATCPVGPTGVGHGHRGIDVSFPEGTLSFCLARNQVDTVSVTMSCIDQCFYNQPLKPTYMGLRDWPCWDPATYQACPDHYFEISVIPVNDPPGHCPERTAIQVPECTEAANSMNGGCSYSVDVYPSRPVAGRRGYILSTGGGPDEANQKVDVHVASTTPSIYELTPTLDPDTGRLEFKMKTYANTISNNDHLTVTFTDDGGASDQWCSGAAGPGSSPCPPGSDTTECDIQIIITSVNQPPLWTPGADVDVDEDNGLTRIPGFASMISPGEDPAEHNQVLSFTCVSDPVGMFDIAPTIDPLSGDLELHTALNSNGQAEVTCHLSDQIDATPHSFYINVNSINDCPVLNLTESHSICTEGHACTHHLNTSYWGADNEASQAFSYDIWLHPQFGGQELFSTLPTAASDGWLKYTCRQGADGVTTIRVTIRDDGGGAPPDCDKGEAVDLSITCGMQNRQPSFDIPSPTVEVWEDQGNVTVERHAVGIDKGHPVEGWQTLTFTVTTGNPSFYTTLPTMDPVLGTLWFEAAQGVVGTDQVTVVLHDDAGENNASVPVVFEVVVKPEGAPGYLPGGVLTVYEDGGPVSVLWATSVDAGGLSSYNFEVDPGCGVGYTKTPVVVEKDDATGEGVVAVHVVEDVNGEFDCEVCVVNEKNLSSCEVMVVRVLPVNDPPTFATSTDEIQLVEDQDGGEVTLSGFITSAVVGPQDEADAGQFLRWKIEVVEGGGVLSSVPSIVNNVDLKMSLEKDAWGDGVLAVTATDYHLNTVSKNASKIVRFHVAAVNDPPAFTPGESVSLDTTTPTRFTTQWATSITTGALDEDTTQTITFTTTPANTLVTPTITPDGVLSIDPPLQGSTGVIMFNVTATDTGTPAMTSPPAVLTVYLGAKPIYKTPEWIVLNDTLTVMEDSRVQVVPGLGEVSPAPRGEWVTLYEARVVSGRDIFKTDSVKISTVGVGAYDVLTLQFEPEKDRYGTASVEIVVRDTSGTVLQPKSVTVEVTPVNDVPSFTPIDRLTVLHYDKANAAEIKVAGWVRRELVTAGPFEDFTQNVDFHVIDEGGLVVHSSMPYIDSGDLYLPLSGVVGEEEFTVFGVDNVPNNQLETQRVNVVVIVTEGKQVITTEMNIPLESWSSGGGGGNTADIEVARLKLEEAVSELNSDPDNVRLTGQVAVLRAELEALEGQQLLLSTGDVLRVQDENVFVAQFRRNISSSLGVFPTNISVISVAKSPTGTTVVWSLPDPTTFLPQKSTHHNGLYTNSTVDTAPPPPPGTFSTPPPSSGDDNKFTLAMIITALVLSALFLCVAAYLLCRKRKEKIKMIEG